MIRTSKEQNSTPEQFEPVERMVGIIRASGVSAFENPGAWQRCLCALVLSLDPKCKIYKLLEALPYDSAGIDESGIMNILAHMGYFSRQVTVDLNAIDRRLFPCLFLESDGNPVVLIAEEDDGRIRVFKNGMIDRVGKKKIFSRKGMAYIFERFDENRPATSKFMRDGTAHGWFRAMAGRFRGTFAQILCAGLVLNFLSIGTPLLIMLVYNRVISTGTPAVLPMLVTGMLISISFEMVLRTIRSNGLSWISARMDNIVGNKIFSHLIGLSPKLIEKASVASQIARIKTFESIRDFFCSSVFLSMIELPFVALAALAIYLIAGPLVLVPLIMCAVYGVLFLLIHKKVKTAIRVSAKASSVRQMFTIEAFEKIRSIRSYGLTSLWQSRYRDLSGKETMAQFKLNFLGMLGETFGNALTILSAVVTIGFGVHMIWAGTLSTGALVATMILVWRVITPFYNVCTLIPRLEQIRNSILQVNQLMDIDGEAYHARAAAMLPQIRGNIAFSNVNFRYMDDSDMILSNLSFEARAGDLVAITGENGSGKSSILKLVKGLYRQTSGSVLIDGFDIRQLDPVALRKQIAYIPQQADFFYGTILENLRLCNPTASEEDVYEALSIADAEYTINGLPAGIHTIIDRYTVNSLPDDLNLRLTLARLYLHTAPLLLIDEIPNMILSGKAGRNLKEYLSRNKSKRTCLMVTHREDFLKIADTIIYLRAGEIALQGSTDKMINLVMEAA